MKSRIPLLAAALVAGLLSSPAQATTTLYRFCSDSSDGSLVADNIAAAETAGWVISGKGSTTTSVGSGTYSNPMRVNTATTLTSPGMPSGTRIVSTTIGGRTSNTAGKYVVTPIYADGTTGTAIDAVFSSTGALLEIPVSFGSGKNVSSFRIAREGDGTMYFYYVKVDSLVVLPSPANLDLVGVAGENGFSVEWDGVQDAEGYSVKLLDSNDAVVSSNDVATTSATFSGLTASTAYTVSVVALGDHATTDDSAAATLSVETAAPAGAVTLDTPSGFACTTFSYATASFEWQAVSGAEGYSFTLSPADGSVSVSGETATVSGLSEGTSYTASVVALGNDTTTVDSAAATVSFTTLVHVQLAAPAGLAASAVTDSGFTLSWSAVANAASYSVSVLDGNDAAAGTVSVSGTTATVTGLSADTAFTAKVKALAPSGNTPYLDSEWSDTVSVTTELADGLKWGAVFGECFSGMTSTTSWGSNSKILSTEGNLGGALTDMDPWYGNTLYNAPGAPRFGNASNYGWVQSPGVALSNDVSSATVKVTFSAIALHANAASALVFSVLDANGDVMEIDGVSPIAITLPVVDSPESGSTVAAELDKVGGSSQKFKFTAPTGFKLKFDTSSAANSNIAIDDILVFQVVDPNYAPLPAPAGLATNEVDDSSISVSWNAVAGATGYSATLLDEAGERIDSLSCASSETTAAFSGLVSSTPYTVSVIALGDDLRTGDSAPATLGVETAASVIPPPTLVVSVTSWTAGIAGTSAVSATLVGGDPCSIQSVSMSDDSDATVANGIISWTPPASATAYSVTATFTVTHASGSWAVSETLSVAATPAPSAPVIQFSNATHSSFDASWSATAGGPVASYKIRAWSGRETPDDPAGSASENFAGYNDGVRAKGWIFKNSRGYANAAAPIGFSNNNDWIASPDYGEATITNISFDAVQQGSVSGSHFYVYGTAGSTNKTDWILLGEATDAETGKLTTGMKRFDVPATPRISRVMFQYQKSSGNVSFGTFSVSGLNWPAANFLEGWGGAKVSVGSATSQTFLQPVPGVLNYVEVTAMGPAGATAVSRASVAVPRPAPTKITIW